MIYRVLFFRGGRGWMEKGEGAGAGEGAAVCCLSLKRERRKRMRRDKGLTPFSSWRRWWVLVSPVEEAGVFAGFLELWHHAKQKKIFRLLPQKRDEFGVVARSGRCCPHRHTHPLPFFTDPTFDKKIVDSFLSRIREHKYRQNQAKGARKKRQPQVRHVPDQRRRSRVRL